MKRPIAIATLSLMCAGALSGCSRPDGIDGRWAVVSVGANPVSASEWWLEVQEGRIVGGRDGCNRWRYQDADSPLVLSDAQECPSDPRHTSYWNVVKANRSVAGPKNEGLTLSAGSDQLILRKVEGPA